MKRVLLIEDNELIQVIVKHHLKNCTVECLDQLKGVEASINANKPDLVVLDYNLADGKTGIDILKLIKILDNSIKVIMITVQSRDITKQAFANGAFDCHYKEDDLMNYISDVVRNLD